MFRLTINPIAATDTERDAVAMLARGLTREDVCEELNVDDEWLTEAIESVKGTLPPAPPNTGEIDALLAKADKSTSKAVRRVAAKVRTSVEYLVAALAAAAEEERYGRAMAAQHKKALADITAARKALADATADGPDPAVRPRPVRRSEQPMNEAAA